jgi:nucleotide-binding universal stress UspA family protein
MSSDQKTPQAEISVKPYSRILAAYDGSSHSKRALMRAAKAARDHGSSLMIVTVVDLTVISMAPMSPPIPEEVYNGLMQGGKDLLSQALGLVQPTVPGASGVVEEGNAAQAILRVASARESDLIVVGRRGISGVERFLIGGVSSNVVAHSKCDVLVVK